VGLIRFAIFIKHIILWFSPINFWHWSIWYKFHNALFTYDR